MWPTNKATTTGSTAESSGNIGHQLRASSSRTSFLPDDDELTVAGPTRLSLQEEIDREMNLQQAHDVLSTASGRDASSPAPVYNANPTLAGSGSAAPGSILFPSTRQRPHSIGSMPTGANDSTPRGPGSPRYDLRESAYGVDPVSVTTGDLGSSVAVAQGQDSRAPDLSGSRPPSRSSTARPQASDPNIAPISGARVPAAGGRRTGHPVTSTSSTAYGGYTTSSRRQSSYQYEDQGDVHEDDHDEHYQTERMTHQGARLVNGNHRQTGPVREAVRVPPSAALITTASRAQTPAPDGILQDGRLREADDTQGERQPKERSDELASDEAWYMLRALIGQEIEYEEKLLWRLKSLDHSQDRPDTNNTERDEDDLDDENADIDPSEVPLLRYLIRHFLLTLPLVRDVPHSNPDQATSSTPAYWAEGILPVLRAIHEADLSHAQDHGAPASGGQVYGIYVRKAIERFVGAGLKLSTRRHGTSPEPDFTETSETDEVSLNNPSASAPVAYNFRPRVPPAVVDTTSGESAPASPRTVASTSTDDEGTTPSATRQSSPRPKSNRFSFSNLFRVVSGGGTGSGSDSQGGHASSAGAASKRNTITSLLSDSKAGPPPLAPVVVNSAGSDGSKTGTSQLPLPLSTAFPVPPAAPTPAAQSQENSIHPSGLSRSTSRATATGTSALETASFVSARERATADESDFEGQDYFDRVGYQEDNDDAHEMLADSIPLTATTTSRPQSRAKTHAGPLSSQVEPYRVDDSVAGQHRELDDTVLISRGTIDDGLNENDTTTSKVHKRKSTGSNKSTRAASPDTHAHESVAASRRVPFATSSAAATETGADDFVAHMALPEAALTEQRPVSALPPVQGDLVVKGGVPWPFGDVVPFWRGVPYDRLKWGGFEADVVGVRSNIFSHSFIIRVRRPARLDEYVVRTEAQFLKYFKVLDKQFPQAHIRRIPTSDPKDDQIVRPRPGSASSSSVNLTRPSPLRANSSTSQVSGARGSWSQSRLAIGLREAAADPAGTRTSSLHSGGAAGDKRGSAGTSSSFARALRTQSVNGQLPPSSGSRERRNTTSGASRAYSLTSNRSKTTLAARLKLGFSSGKTPPYDARRRALRAWLRDTLSIRTVGHHTETAAFLLLGSIVPKDSDVNDIYRRETIDEARRAARVGVAQGAAHRAKATRSYWTEVEQECIHGDGFVDISNAIRDSPSIDKLPVRYFKVIESVRYSFAQAIYDSFVASDSSARLFGKFKALHAAFPYFLVRQAFKFGRSRTMANYLQDILLSRPFGSKSLLQKILAITLDDDPAKMLREASALRSRIGSSIMCEKIDTFVYDVREKKEIIRQYAKDNGVELVLCIVRGADEPRLQKYELERVVRASKKYANWAKTNPSPLARAKVTDSEIRLVLDLQDYLRLVSRDRDATTMRSLLGQDDIARALEVLAGPFVELLKRTYKVGNSAAALTSLQRFIDQLIIIIDALRSRIQEPQRSVRIIARLLERHESALYDFIRNVHRGESLIEEFLQWFWTASVFLRRGLAEPIDLEAVLPEDHEDRLYLLEEVEELVAFQRRKRTKQYQNTCRRYAGDVDGDDPVIVEGDGNGRSRVEPLKESKLRKPELHEIPTLASAFHEQLKKVLGTS